MKIAFYGTEIPAFAARLVACALDRAGRPTDLASACETVARAFGHAGWADMAAHAGVSLPYRRALEIAAAGLTRETGLPRRDCAELARLMHLPGREHDSDEAADILVDLEIHFAGSPRAKEIVNWFEERQGLLCEAGLALRLRRAGKKERGAEAGLAGHLDLLDAIHDAGDAPLPRAVAAYLSVPVHMTVHGDGMRPCDAFPALLAAGAPRRRLETLLVHARGTVMEDGLCHPAMTEIVRATALPVPGDPNEIGSAVCCYWILRDLADRVFGTPHPFDLLTEDDWEECGEPPTWHDLVDMIVSNGPVDEAVDAAFERIARFVADHAPGAGFTPSALSCAPDGVLDLVEFCFMAEDADDRMLASLLVSAPGQMFSDAEGRIADAICAVARARQPRRVRTRTAA